MLLRLVCIDYMTEIHYSFKAGILSFLIGLNPSLVVADHIWKMLAINNRYDGLLLQYAITTLLFLARKTMIVSCVMQEVAYLY